jgi:hypothetical protein
MCRFESLLTLLAVSPLLGCGTGPVAADPPDSNHYALCEIDSQCPAGSYCSGGVCDLDCHSDAECPDSKSCDSRGACGANASDVKGVSGHLKLPVQRITLPVGQTQAIFRVENDGTDRLERFHVLSSDPTITASPATGSLPPGMGVDVQLTLGHGFIGPTGNLHVLSTGGKGTLALECHSSLEGRLEGTVTPQSPVLLAPSSIAMELGPALTGSLDGEQTLLWPQNAAVQGTDDGTNFQASFSLVGLPGSDVDPLFDLPLRRTVRMTGIRDSSGLITGAYSEAIEGLPSPDGGPLVLQGSFRLRRVGKAKGLQAAASPAFAPGAPSSPPGDISCHGETDCPKDRKKRADYFFASAFPFEQWGEESQIADGLCQLGTQSAPVPCVDDDHAARALAAFTSNGDVDGSWDVWRAIASYGLLSGNDHLAQVLEPALAQYQGPAVDELALTDALDALARGLHQGEGPGGLLRSRNLIAALQQPPSSDTRDVAPDDAHRFPVLVSTRLLAASEMLDRMARAGDGALVQQRMAQRAAGAAEIDLAALSLFPGLGLGAEPNDGAADLAARFGEVSSAFDRTRRELNPAGFTERYIPFDYDPQNPTLDLFQQASASAQGYLASAQQIEQQLSQSHRGFEESSSALDQALLDAASEAETEIHDLCGQGTDPQTLQGCGNGGRIAAAVSDMQAAQTALGESLDRLIRANLKILLLQQQAQREFQDQIDELTALTSDGQTIALYARHKAQEEQAAKATNLFGAILGTIAGVLTLNPVQVLDSIGDVVNAGVQVGMSETDDQMAYQSSLAQSDVQIQLALGQNVIRDDTLGTMIFDANTDAQTAAHEIDRQTSLFIGAAQRLQGLYGEVAQAQTAWAAKTRDLGRHRDPTFRLYRDQTGMQWGAAMRLVRKWVFLATRAFEYTANASYAGAAGVFTSANAREVQSYLSGLTDAYQTDRLQNGWGQARSDVISVRRDILGIDGSLVDPVTGKTLTPADQFHQILALPQNRDDLGDVSLKFRTSFKAGNGIFSRSVCEDRIAGLKMNLVSASLQGDTAYIGLRQVGRGELLSCAGGNSVDYQLGGKTAEIPAGLNLSRAALDSPGLPESTDLFERPVSADSWILTIDTRSEPRNQWLVPQQLDDIEIWFAHTARTLQSGS